MDTVMMTAVVIVRPWTSLNVDSLAENSIIPRWHRGIPGTGSHRHPTDRTTSHTNTSSGKIHGGILSYSFAGILVVVVLVCDPGVSASEIGMDDNAPG